jgi:nucleotidyltransferase/DNA polymerase involved in DNA repair
LYQIDLYFSFSYLLLQGVGHHLYQKFQSLAIETCEDFIAIPRSTLSTVFGEKMAENLWALAHGEDIRKLKYGMTFKKYRFDYFRIVKI